MREPNSEFGRLLAQSAAGSASAMNSVSVMVYDELHDIAVRLMRRENPGHILQPTALVGEAFVRLAGQDRSIFESRSHFVAIASVQMRRALVDYARRENAQIRGRDWQRVSMTGSFGASDGESAELLDLCRALAKLEKLHMRHCRVFEYRFFGDLTVQECSRELGVSEKTVKNDWRFVLAWLARELGLGHKRDDA